MNYLRSGKLVTPGLSKNMLRKLKIEAQFYNLQDLRNKIVVAEVMEAKPNDVVVIDASGTRVKTTRKIISKGQDCNMVFFRLFDPHSPKFIQTEDDGSYKIDLDPRYVQYWLARAKCDPFQSQVRHELRFIYDKDMMAQWELEFKNKYC